MTLLKVARPMEMGIMIEKQMLNKMNLVLQEIMQCWKIKTMGLKKFKCKKNLTRLPIFCWRSRLTT
jgi:hypothetical protein